MLIIVLYIIKFILSKPFLNKLFVSFIFKYPLIFQLLFKMNKIENAFHSANTHAQRKKTHNANLFILSWLQFIINIALLSLSRKSVIVKITITKEEKSNLNWHIYKYKVYSSDPILIWIYIILLTLLWYDKYDCDLITLMFYRLHFMIRILI